MVVALKPELEGTLQDRLLNDQPVIPFDVADPCKGTEIQYAHVLARIEQALRCKKDDIFEAAREYRALRTPAVK